MLVPKHHSSGEHLDRWVEVTIVEGEVLMPVEYNQEEPASPPEHNPSDSDGSPEVDTCEALNLNQKIQIFIV